MKLVAWLLGGLVAAQSPNDLATIEGRVVNSITGRPMKQATVTLADRATRSSVTATTDADGRFVFGQVAAGTYGVSTAREGFLFTPPPLFQVEPRQLVKDLTLKLTPMGVISGKLLDEDGEPIANVQVQVARRRYVNGKRQLTPDREDTSDDRGEYRIFHVPPGRYYLAAHRYPAHRGESGLAASFYPGVAQPSEATLLEITAGQELRDMDFRLPRSTPRYRIGVKASPDRRVTGSEVTVGPADRTFWRYVETTSRRADGTLEFINLPPGAYRVSARIVDDVKGVLVGSDEVHLTSANVDVALTLRSAVKVHGSISMPALLPRPPETRRGPSRVLLDPLDIDESGPPSAYVEASQFTLPAAIPGRYRVRWLTDLQGPFYLKSVRWNGDDLHGTLLDLSSASDGMLELIVASDDGAIHGAVDGRSGQAIPSTIALLPVSPNSAHLAQETRLQPDGRFGFLNVPPGDYRVVAPGQMEPGSAQDPEFAKEYEKHGILVTVRPSTRETIDKPVPVIAAVGR